MQGMTDLQPYDVLQSSNGMNGSWLDYATLRDASDFASAKSMVARTRDYISGTRFRVVRSGKVILS